MLFKIFKMIANCGVLTALECTKFVFGRGSAPDLAGRVCSALPDLLAGLRGPTSKGRGEDGKERDRRGRGSGEKEIKGRGKGK